MQHDHSFGELRGRLDHAFRPPLALRDKVVLSRISHGEHLCTQAAGVGIKYVACGTEYYSFGGRTHAVGAGQFLLVSQSLASEVEVRKTGTETLGLCLFLKAAMPAEEPDPILLSPLIFSDRCSRLGTLLAGALADFLRPGCERPKVAVALLADVRSNLDSLVADTVTEFTSLGHVRASTRFESLRRLHRARGYLHEVLGRSVELSELASVCGISRFQLLRQFKECFGETPAAYHRRLRLELARDAIEREGLSCSETAYRYGFASGSSLSHAFRRYFNEAPVRVRRL